MNRAHVVIALASCTLACSANDEGRSTGPSTAQVPVANPTVTLSLASVQLLEDCPDAEATMPEAASLQAEDQGASDGDWELPCTQSTMQLAFSGAAGKVVIKELRLLAASGEELATLDARAPSQWRANAYVPWDETLAGAELKASYKISMPTWGAVDKALGGSSYDASFVLEVDVEIAGAMQTLRSSAVVREPVEMIET